MTSSASFAPRSVDGRRYGFNCPWCSSRLEAVGNQGGSKGECPTCGTTITIPILDRYGRLIDPDTGKIVKPDPHPVHAYAAAGERAPQIIKQGNGLRGIQCSRCKTVNPITSDVCRSCGMPFTMEGTTHDPAANNGWSVASLVLGIIGIPACMVVVPAALAIILGIIGYNRAASGEVGGKGMAITGIILGVIGAAIGVLSITR